MHSVNPESAGWTWHCPTYLHAKSESGYQREKRSCKKGRQKEKGYCKNECRREKRSCGCGKSTLRKSNHNIMVKLQYPVYYGYHTWPCAVHICLDLLLRTLLMFLCCDMLVSSGSTVSNEQPLLPWPSAEWSPVWKINRALFDPPSRFVCFSITVLLVRKRWHTIQDTNCVAIISSFRSE